MADPPGETLEMMWRLIARSVQPTVVLAVAMTCATGNLAWAQSERLGARTVATVVMGELPQVPLYWHLYTYPSREAAEAAREARGVVAQSQGKVWLFAVTEADWRPTGGESVAKIGPLPLRAGGRFIASYLEAVTPPGFQTDVHQHAGPEALYTLSGEACLETPQGRFVSRAGGDPLIVAGDQPMRLTDTGTQVRHSLVLILHDAAHPWKTPATGWTPKGLCGS